MRVQKWMGLSALCLRLLVQINISFPCIHAFFYDMLMGDFPQGLCPIQHPKTAIVLKQHKPLFIYGCIDLSYLSFDHLSVFTGENKLMYLYSQNHLEKGRAVLSLLHWCLSYGMYISEVAANFAFPAYDFILSLPPPPPRFLKNYQCLKPRSYWLMHYSKAAVNCMDLYLFCLMAHLCF